MTKRFAAAITLGALSMLLAACLLTPGKFVSSLDLRKDGQFNFAYRGEISMFGLAQIAAMGKKDTEFKPQPCFESNVEAKPGAESSDSGAMAERPCTTAEIAGQKSDWEAERKVAAAKDKKELEEMKAAFGGLDPTDPRSIEEFATRLRRQSGWRTVTYKGDGLFDVDFAIAGKLDHDFIFPVIEKFPTANTFVQILRRTDGTVRVDTPGFAANSTSSPMGQMMGMGAMGKLGDAGKDGGPKPAEMDGIFTITTNGAILANNTEEGPKADPAGQKLDWKVSVRTTSAPTALIRIGG